MIAGLEQPDTGAIRLDGAVVAGRAAWVPPERRRVGLVFQDFALFPHLTVAENIAFALKRSHEPVARSKRVGEMLDLVGLIGL
ncbi:MAG TPA: ATP-binding cassette domain-containing protein, partial [Anaerolineales bacterium]|nr:ATP-binding cassette domain-containing protein [Anaerolineales bacterium]